MIGSKRETVTKAFTLLQRAVELKRRRTYVKDVDKLKSVLKQGLHQSPVR